MAMADFLELPDFDDEVESVDLFSEADIIQAIRDAVADGGVPSYVGYSKELLDSIIDGSRGIDKYVYDRLIYILPDLGIKFDYLWSPYRQERADKFSSYIPQIGETPW